jgi:hypothetical protein
MFGIFRKKSEKERLQKQYKRLMEEAFVLSKSNRSQGDAKYAEADALLKKIDALP